MAVYLGFCLACRRGLLDSEVVGTAIKVVRSDNISLVDLEREAKEWAEARWPKADGWWRHQGHVTMEIARTEAEDILANAREKAEL